MFKGLNYVAYSVSNLQKAKQWYGRVFDTEPLLDTSVAVLFSVGEAMLILTPAASPIVEDDHRIIKRLLEYRLIVGLIVVIDSRVRPLLIVGSGPY